MPAMFFHDRIVIEAPADRVWQYVGSPDLWDSFHAKATCSKHVGGQPGGVGAEYEMTFHLGSRAMPSCCKIVDLRPGAMIQVLSTVSCSRGKPSSAVLTYTLHDLGSRTKVAEEIRIIEPRTNFLLRAIVWLVSRFGQPVGETTLRRLKRLVEEGQRP